LRNLWRAVRPVTAEQHQRRAWREAVGAAVWVTVLPITAAPSVAVVLHLDTVVSAAIVAIPGMITAILAVVNYRQSRAIHNLVNSTAAMLRGKAEDAARAEGQIQGAKDEQARVATQKALVVAAEAAQTEAKK
jgi:hypothetical protein